MNLFALKKILRKEIIDKVDDILESSMPDCVLVLGDTNSAWGVIGAKKRKIPIFHFG